MNIFITILFSLLCLQLFGQVIESGDTVYVATKSGLVIRSSPGKKSMIKGKLSYNEPIIYSSTGVIDTIDNRISEWVKVGDQGYVFGGYLNQYRLPTKDYGVLNEYIPDFANKFQMIHEKKYYLFGVGFSKSEESKSITLRDGLTIVSEESYEYSKIDYYFEDISINEFINLFELMKYYYGDQNNEMKLDYRYAHFRTLVYSVPDAGMGRNEIRQLDNEVVRLTFVFGL